MHDDHRRLLQTLRERYHTQRVMERPNLDDPRSTVGLLRASESLELVQSGHWPLSADDVAFIKRPLTVVRRQWSTTKDSNPDFKRPSSAVRPWSETKDSNPDRVITDNGQRTTDDARVTAADGPRHVTRSRKQAKAWWEPLARYHYLPEFPALTEYAITAPNGSGVILIAFPARHSHMRNKVFPCLATMPWEQQAQWMKTQLRVLARVVVHPDYRRMGLASHLIQQALQYLPCPFLECFAHTEKCGDLFEKNGFKALHHDGQRAKIEGMPTMPPPGYWFWGGASKIADGA